MDDGKVERKMAMIHHKPPTCPKCGKPMNLYWAVVSTFPYTHTDYIYRHCGKEYIFGVPDDLIIGLSALIIWAKNPIKALLMARRKEKHLKPICPFCKVPMKMVKVVEFEDGVFVQWKCPKCFYSYNHPKHTRYISKKWLGENYL